MLFGSDVKEELGLAYVRAVAARAGFSVEETRKDRDGVDLTICARGKLSDDAVSKSPRLEVQLKSTAALGALPPVEFSYELDADDYNHLVGPRLVPRILLVFVMPKSEAQWLSWTEDSLVLRHSAYWLSLAGRESTTNIRSKSVKVPRGHVFNPESIRSLLTLVACRRELPP
ncbi:MAG TPA: DUF4365 domain-containing protein [Polyangiaceae bacterium]|nr:DUF4365 domain-containing protein [Polyangiaceae bacterium]